MEVGKVGRLSTSGRMEVNSNNATPDRVKSATTNSGRISCHGNHHQHASTMKMFNKVQVVYYLTRNGQLEHPHYMEVSHLVTQPLRLKDVIDRLAVLRGKAMPCQYSWSCKRSYKSGYVWNDLTENDVIYATEGSEYVLKGSELVVQDKDDFSGGTRQGQNYRQLRQIVSKHQEQEAVKNYKQTVNNNDDEDEEKGSCDSSNAPYAGMQMEQEESYSLPSTSSEHSDKQPLPPPPTRTQAAVKTTVPLSESIRAVEEDGDPTVSTSLTRSSTVNLLHLITCGGGGIIGPQSNDKGKPKAVRPNNVVGGNRNFSFRMKSSFMPCLKQQLSTKGVSTSNNALHLRAKAGGVGGVGEERQPCKAGDGCDHTRQVVLSKEHEDEDEDMMMVRYMSENPRFGNLQSEEKEYFSGTIVEAMSSTHHQHTCSSGSASCHSHPPVFTKSSSYNEQRISKAGLQAAAGSTAVDGDDDKKDAKAQGIIKLCIPRKKSFSSTSTKHN